VPSTEMPEVEPSVFRGEGDVSRAFGLDDEFEFEKLVLPPYTPNKFEKHVNFSTSDPRTLFLLIV